jgi:hypothetical protein
MNDENMQVIPIAKESIIEQLKPALKMDMENKLKRKVKVEKVDWTDEGIILYLTIT